MAEPNYQEGAIMLQAAQWGASLGIREATNWMRSSEYIPDYDEFVKKYPRGTPEYLNITKICGFFETLGALYKHKLISDGLLFDWLAVSSVWEQVKDFTMGVRKQTGNPRLYENFEVMAQANVSYDAEQLKAK
jgi:hypothetical protein